MRMFESLRRLKLDIVEPNRGTMNGVCVILLQPSELELLWMKKSPDLECITVNKEVGSEIEGRQGVVLSSIKQEQVQHRMTRCHL
jgi:hypothetical protein